MRGRSLHCYAQSVLSRPANRQAQRSVAESGRTNGRFIALRNRDEVLVDASTGVPCGVPLHVVEAAAARSHLPLEEVFLGVDQRTGDAHYAVDVSDCPEDGFDGTFVGIRSVAHGAATAAAAGHGDAAMPSGLAAAGLARNLLMWLKSQRFCGSCGAARAPLPTNGGGWSFVCGSCGTESFPRVDPVVITAVASADGERCLLGRQATWPAGMHSCLAGFLDPGETVEEGVAREVLEEAGVVVRPGSVQYHSSQPWLCGPSTQVMLGTLCVAEDETIAVDTHELESAMWCSRAELEIAIRVAEESMRDRTTSGVGVHGDVDADDAQRVWIPPPVAMAHHLIKAFVEDEPR